MKSTMKKVLAGFVVLMLICADICALADTIMLPQSLEVIDKEAFASDSSIEKVVVPDGTGEIRSRAFAYSSVTEVSLPQSIESIASDAFLGCTDVTILVYEDSYAHKWAVSSGLKYRVYDFCVSGVTVYTKPDAETGMADYYIGANVTAERDCVLYLSLYDENQNKYTFQKNIPVAAPVEEKFIDVKTDVSYLDNYRLEAVLLDAENGNLLCEPTENLFSSNAYENVINKRPSSYPKERLIDYGSVGYMVLASDVILLNEEAKAAGDSYTFYSARPLELVKGDVVQLLVDSEPAVVKVKQFLDYGYDSRYGYKYLIGADQDVALEEMFDVIKLDGYLSTSKYAVSGIASDDAQYFSWKQSLSADPVTVGIELKTSIRMQIDYFKSLNDFQFTIIMESEGNVEGTIKAEYKQEDVKPLEIPIINQTVFLPVVKLPAKLKVTVPLEIEAEVGGTFGFGFSDTEVICVSRKNGISKRKESAASNTKVNIEGEFSLFAGPKLTLSTSLFGALDASADVQFGPKLESSLYTLDQGSTNAESIHACYTCLDMELLAVATGHVEVEYDLFKNMSGTLLEAEFGFYEEKLADGFCSLWNDVESIYGGKVTMDWGKCRNYKYRATISTLDKYVRPSTGIPVAISGGRLTDKFTGASTLKTYLYNGTYTAEAAFAECTETESFVIKDGPGQVIIQEPAIDIGGCVSDYSTGKPIYGASVSIVAPGNRTISLTTDSDGNYTAEKLPYGEYELVFEATGYESKTINSTVSTGNFMLVNCELEPIVPDPNLTPFARTQVKHCSSMGDSITAGAIDPGRVTAGGKVYTDAWVFDMRYTGNSQTGGIAEATYNFKGEYSMLTFDAGFCFSHYPRNAELKVYADGVLVLNDTLKYTDAPRKYSIALSGVNKLTIRMESDGYDYNYYMIGDIRLYPGAQPTEAVRSCDANINSFRSKGQQASFTSDGFSMGGYNYRDGYILNMGYGFNTSDTSYIGFDLDGRVNTFSFDICKVIQRVPEHYLDSAFMTITVDGVTVAGYDKKELKWNDLILPVSVDVSGAQEILITLNYYPYDRGYWGIGNIHIDQ